MATRHVSASHWPIDDVLDRTDLAALLDELTQPAGRASGRAASGTARCPTTTTTTPR